MVHKIDGPGAGPGGTWVEATPGVPKTIATAKWLNMLQGEPLAILAAAGVTPSDTSTTQVSEALDILLGSSSAAALKNRLVNGGVFLWQRGTLVAFTNVEAYTADRWAAIADQPGSGVGQADVSRITFPTGQVEVPDDPPYYLRWTQNVPSTAGAPMLVQKIEDVASMAGGPASISLWCRAFVNTVVTLRLVQSFGTGGSADIVVGSSTVPISTAWGRQTATFTVPSILGKTVGLGSSLRFEIIFPTGTIFTHDFANLQVEPDENATPFERRALQVEYELAARYFEKSYPLDIAPGAIFTTGIRSVQQQIGGSAPRFRGLGQTFRVRKRSVPTMGWYAVEGAITPGTATLYSSSGVLPEEVPGAFFRNAVVAATIDTGETSSGAPRVVFVSGEVDFQFYAAGNWTADAEL